jgi:hypothetical protein
MPRVPLRRFSVLIVLVRTLCGPRAVAPGAQRLRLRPDAVEPEDPGHGVGTDAEFADVRVAGLARHQRGLPRVGRLLCASALRRLKGQGAAMMPVVAMRRFSALIVFVQNMFDRSSVGDPPGT